MAEEVEEKGKVFVKYVPVGTTREELLQLFSAIGPLREVILPRPKGHYTTVFGFVSFQEAKDTEKAISQYNDFELCNSIGNSSRLSVGKSFQRVSRLQSGLNKGISSSLWSIGSQESDKASSDGSVPEIKLPDPEAEWMKERKALLAIIDENDIKIREMEKKKGQEELGDDALEKKEKQLLEDLKKFTNKKETLKEEIQVLTLQVRLKELEKEQNQILNQ